MSTKKTEQAPIAVEEVLSKSEAFAHKYKNAIIGAVVAIVLFVVGSTLYKQYVSAPAEKEAAEALYAAQALFDEGKFQEALDGDGANLGLIAVAEEYSGKRQSCKRIRRIGTRTGRTLSGCNHLPQRLQRRRPDGSPRSKGCSWQLLRTDRRQRQSNQLLP